MYKPIWTTNSTLRGLAYLNWSYMLHKMEDCIFSEEINSIFDIQMAWVKP